jgi:hypothetical protein
MNFEYNYSIIENYRVIRLAMPIAQIPHRASRHLNPPWVDRQLIYLNKRLGITIIHPKGDRMPFGWIKAALVERNISNTFGIIWRKPPKSFISLS